MKGMQTAFTSSFILPPSSSPLHPLTREPHGNVADVGFDVFERLWFAPVAVAGRLREEAGTALVGVEVVIHEVMKARLGDSATESVAVRVGSSVERDGEVERAPRRLAHARCDDARRVLARGDSDRAFVRVRGEEAYDASAAN